MFWELEASMWPWHCRPRQNKTMSDNEVQVFTISVAKGSHVHKLKEMGHKPIKRIQSLTNKLDHEDWTKSCTKTTSVELCKRFHSSKDSNSVFEGSDQFGLERNQTFLHYTLPGNDWFMKESWVQKNTQKYFLEKLTLTIPNFHT